ncbi:MAG: DNA polymerase III subunit delta [Nitrospiria bacterium]
MNFQEGMRQIDQGRFAPCYLITGEETWLVEALLLRLAEKAIDPSTGAFNDHRFRGEEMDPNEVVSIANTYPVSSPRRMIIVRRAEGLKDERGVFLNYFSHPANTTLLVFISEKPDMRKKLFTTLKRRATVIHCPRMIDRQLSGWIHHEAEKRGIRLSQEGIWSLKEQIGNDLSSLQREIEKLALYATIEKTGSEDQIREVSDEILQMTIGCGRSHSIFELTRAVGEKDKEMALRLLHCLLEEGAHPLFILSMLTRQLRQMTIAGEMLAAGSSVAEVSKKIPMPPGLFKRFLQQLKKWRRDETRRGLMLSLSADSQLKGGGISPKIILDIMILDLCSANGSATENRISMPPLLLQEGV